AFYGTHQLSPPAQWPRITDDALCPRFDKTTLYWEPSVQPGGRDLFHPHQAFELLSALMNCMVVQLMKSADDPSLQRELQRQRDGREARDGYDSGYDSDDSVAPQPFLQRHASEKALEGYCAFQHLLLFIADRYPSLALYARERITDFIRNPDHRNKRHVPDL